MKRLILGIVIGALVFSQLPQMGADPGPPRLSPNPQNLGPGSAALIPAGARHIEFIVSADFAGSIQTDATGGGWAAINGSLCSVYTPGDPPPGSTFGQVRYNVTAGTALLTTW